MRDRLRSTRLVTRVFALALLVPLVGLALVVAAEVVPDGRIAYALLRSIDRGDLTTENYVRTGLGNQIDKFGDCIVLGNGLGDPPGGSLLSRSVASPSLGSCETMVPRLERFRETEQLRRQYDYFRYWHGNAVFVRPAVGILGVTTTRALVAVGLLAAIGTLGWSLARMSRARVGLALLGPLVVATDWWDLPESLLHGLVVITMVVSAHWLVRTVRRSPSWQTTALASALCGALFVYVDLLTIPPAAWLLTIGLVGVVAHLDGQDTREIGTAQAVAAVSWLVGFCWMWASKWLIAAIVLGGRRVWDDVTGQAELRLSGGQEGVTDGIGQATARNLEVWLDRPLGIAVTMVVVAVVVVRVTQLGRAEVVHRLPIVAPAIIPVIWWEVMSNHSQVHAWFTYRSLPVALGLVAAVALLPVVTSHATPDDPTSGAPPPLDVR